MGIIVVFFHHWFSLLGALAIQISIHSFTHKQSEGLFFVLCFLCFRPHFSLEIRTNTSKGLILHIAGRGAIPLLALYMANGKIKMSLGQNRIIQHKERSNDGHWHRVRNQVPLQILSDKSSSYLNVGFPISKEQLQFYHQMQVRLIEMDKKAKETQAEGEH